MIGFVKGKRVRPPHKIKNIITPCKCYNVNNGYSYTIGVSEQKKAIRQLMSKDGTHENTV